MKKIISKNPSMKKRKKEKEKNMIINGKEMFINKNPQIEISLYRASEVK